MCKETSRKAPGKSYRKGISLIELFESLKCFPMKPPPSGGSKNGVETTKLNARVVGQTKSRIARVESRNLSGASHVASISVFALVPSLKIQGFC